MLNCQLLETWLDSPKVGSHCGLLHSGMYVRAFHTAHTKLSGQENLTPIPFGEITLHYKTVQCGSKGFKNLEAV